MTDLTTLERTLREALSLAIRHAAHASGAVLMRGLWAVGSVR